MKFAGETGAALKRCRLPESSLSTIASIACSPSVCVRLSL